MLNHLELEKILFLDIETVPQEKEFKNLDQDFKDLWEHKSKYFREKNEMNIDNTITGWRATSNIPTTPHT